VHLRREIIESANLVASLEEFVRKVRAYEPCAAGDENCFRSHCQDSLRGGPKALRQFLRFFEEAVNAKNP
jgi:hypothetical protein